MRIDCRVPVMVAGIKIVDLEYGPSWREMTDGLIFNTSIRSIVWGTNALGWADWSRKAQDTSSHGQLVTLDILIELDSGEYPASDCKQARCSIYIEDMNLDMNFQCNGCQCARKK
jgi:hypothetical protein